MGDPQHAAGFLGERADSRCQREAGCDQGGEDTACHVFSL